MKNKLSSTEINEMLSALTYYSSGQKDSSVARRVVGEMKKRGLISDLMNLDTMDQCKWCLEMYPIHLFSKEARNREGYTRICKMCKAIGNVRLRANKLAPKEAVRYITEKFINSVIYDLPQTTTSRFYIKLLKESLNRLDHDIEISNALTVKRKKRKA